MADEVGGVEWRKMPDFGFGVTVGVTDRGYIFRNEGLHIRVFRGYDRGGGKRMVLRGKVGETAHLRYW